MNDFDRKVFGKKINQIRKNQRITSETLSVMCDVNAVFVRQIESGNRLPSLPVLIKICVALQVSPAYLLDLEFYDNNHSNLSELTKTLSSKQKELICTIAEELSKMNT